MSKRGKFRVTANATGSESPGHTAAGVMDKVEEKVKGDGKATRSRALTPDTEELRGGKAGSSCGGLSSCMSFDWLIADSHILVRHLVPHLWLGALSERSTRDVTKLSKLQLKAASTGVNTNGPTARAHHQLHSSPNFHHILTSARPQIHPRPLFSSALCLSNKSNTHSFRIYHGSLQALAWRLWHGRPRRPYAWSGRQCRASSLLEPR